MSDDKSFEENRHDQLTSAPKATEEDAAARFDVSHHDGVTRIDVRDDAAVRPGPGQGDPAAEEDVPLSEK
nr:multidrug transporter [Microbacterium testaceum]